jgi:hypothetical protein
MVLRTLVILVLVLVLVLVTMSWAQAPDTPEPGSKDAVTEATTEERFVSPWVSTIPEHPTIPSPTDHLGHIAGAPGELTNTETIYAYYRTLAETSDRVRVEVIGRTEEGRDILLVIAGDAESLARLDEAREAMAVLADPRRSDEAAMEKIAAEVFDDEEIPYTLIMDEDVRAGRLLDRFDVIVFPNTYDGLKGIVNGIDPIHSPLA